MYINLQELYEEVTAEMELIRPGTSLEDVKKRWGNLRCQYSENIRASKGKDGTPDKPRKLWCKDILEFLAPVTIPRLMKARKVPDVSFQYLHFMIEPSMFFSLNNTIYTYN
jgi:hypothetical protein